MKPTKFQYFQPGSMDEALALKFEHGDEAMFLAGGQSLVPLMSMRLSRPAAIIDINRVPGLDQLAGDEDGLLVGALVRHTQIGDSEVVLASHPLLVDASRYIGHQTIRNRGTVGGSLAHADPSAEWPAAMLALGAEIHVMSADGARTVDASRLFQGHLTTSLSATEMVHTISVPRPAHKQWAIAEVARRAGDYAIVGVIAGCTVTPDDAVEAVTVVLFGVGPTPVRLDEVTAVTGEPAGPDVAAELARIAAAASEPTGDLYGTERYKRRLVHHLTKRVLIDVFERSKRDR